MNKRLAGTGLAIGLLAGAGAGFVLEISGNAGAASGTAVTATAAGDSTDATTDTTAPGDTTAPATPARPDPSTKLQDVLKPLVADGTITQDQADKVVAALVAARPDGGPDGFPGGGHRGPGGFGGPGGPGGLIGQGLDVVATTLGITSDEVRTALEGGQSLADLAVSKGKTAQDVIDAVVAEATTKVNAAVTAGKLTQDQADKLLANLKTGVTDFVNATPPAGGRGFGIPGLGGPGRGFFPGGRHNGDDANAPTDTTAPTTTVGS
jgi:hypothetical protein